MTKQYNYIEDFINFKRASGAYSFTYNEVYEHFDITKEALNLALLRVKKKGLIAQVRREFYAIIPPEYLLKGMLPATLFIDDLMKSLNKAYYVALFSASFFYGATHQSPMEFFVINSGAPLRNINTSKLKINFLFKKSWATQSVINKKTDAGYVCVSSPELTALDLFFYPDKVSLNRAYTVIQEMIFAIKPAALSKVAEDYPKVSCIQRLGYILDVYLKNEKLAQALSNVLLKKKYHYLPLSCYKKREGQRYKKWKIIINIEPEGDL